MKVYRRQIAMCGLQNTLARMLKERFPDRELYVLLNAYGLARNPPLGIKPDDNVIISSVANFHMRFPVRPRASDASTRRLVPGRQASHVAA